MPVSITATIKSSIPELIATLEAIPEFLAEEVLAVAAEQEAAIVDDLSSVPGKAAMPFEFATPKSRRYYFYLVNSGQVPTDGQHYVRQGGKPYGWYVDVGDDPLIIEIGNTWPQAKWVYGNLTQKPDSRVPGHINTGWQLAKPKVDRWTGLLNRELINRFNTRIEKEGKRAKFARGR